MPSPTAVAVAFVEKKTEARKENPDTANVSKKHPSVINAYDEIGKIVPNTLINIIPTNK